MDRFEKVYSQGIIDVTEIWVDKETGVQYLFHRNGNAAGLAPLLDKDVYKRQTQRSAVGS